MTGAGQWRRIFNMSSVKEQVWLITIWSVYLYIFCRLRNGNFCAPREASRLDIYKCIFFLLIYRKRKFCVEPMRERLTFHFELRTRSGNFRFFFSSFLLSFCFSNQGKISSCNNSNGSMSVAQGLKYQLGPRCNLLSFTSPLTAFLFEFLPANSLLMHFYF